MFRLCLICALALCAAAPPCSAQQEITNDSVIQMTKAGLGDALIIQSVNATPSKFATTTSDIIALKQAGVSERVIGAMVAKNGARPEAALPPPSSKGRVPLDTGTDPPAEPRSTVPADLSLEGVDEMGVYYEGRNGKWVPMEPELLNFRSGGALKSYATDHLVKEDKNGSIMGPTAALALTKETTFLLYMPAGTSPVEFLLLKLRPGAQKSREFRSETGGVFHSQSGATRDRIVFNATRIAPRIYQFNLPAEVTKGEYGILPPSSLSTANAGSAGKIFTFKILE
jgi:hypothetical protein